MFLYFVLLTETICSLFSGSLLCSKIADTSTALFSARSHGLTVESAIYETSSIPFLEHSKNKPFESYLALNVPYMPVLELFNKVNSTFGNGKLVNRGEAHITVISPPEFDNILKPAGVTIKEINELATKSHIQHSKFKVSCLGHAQIANNNPTFRSKGDNIESFMIVVRDSGNDLFNLRKRVYNLYVEKGGQGALFDPQAFWPHITLGFNIRDLFVEDGIYKGENSCIEKVTVV